ncbi:MAG: pitrilysin family protein [Burkholderiaceae bacterium]
MTNMLNRCAAHLIVGTVAFFGLLASAHAVLPIERWTTNSGVDVLFMRADAIPMLDIEVRFDAGDRLDQFAGVGVASMTAAMLDAGAGPRSEAQVADAFARIGAQRSSWSGDDSASVRLRTLLTEPELSQALALFTDMLTTPRFEDAAIQREKQRILQAIRDGDTRANIIARRAYYRLAYGTHPYGYQLDEEKLAAISAQQIRRFHRDYYVRSRATVALIGAINRSTAEKIAATLVAGLPATGADRQKMPSVPRLSSGVEERIAHPGAQSHILIGGPLIARGDPDYFPLLLANSVLGGGGFVSRLYKEVREKRGLTYGVSSGFSLKVQPGLFTIGLQTQREKTEQALGVVRQVLSDYVVTGPTSEELEAARTNLAGGFVFRVDSNRKILGLMSAIGFHDLDIDYLERWVERVNAVTLDQVRDSLKRRLIPDKLVTVVVGALPSGVVTAAPESAK